MTAGMLYACEREGEREREREREREKEEERERCRICPELLYLFLKRMMGALAPFSYLVQFIEIRFNYLCRLRQFIIPSSPASLLTIFKPKLLYIMKSFLVCFLVYVL